MASCCILQCGSKKDKNQPLLTLHRFPKNKDLNKKWLDAIGIENINRRHKNWFVCSLHFAKSNINKTLDVARLHDNVIPSIALPVRKQKMSVSCESLNIEESTQDSTSSIASTHVPEMKENVETCQETPASNKKVNMPSIHFPKVQTDKTIHLTNICNKQRLKIKRLNEMVRRRNKKIDKLKNMLQDIKKKNQENGVYIILLEECSESKDFLQRHVAKSKGLT